jgi:holo-[acyl-carrier protein] synthase
MIVGIGVDLVDVARFETAIANTPKLKDRLFTDGEK